MVGHLVFVGTEEDFAEGGEVLSSVVEIDDLGGVREVHLREGSDPFRAVTEDNDLMGVFQTAPNGFGVDSIPKPIFYSSFS
jgi:hypothetical protein